MSSPLRWLLHPADSYKRRRHYLGFGVHSPMAYRLINDVVRRHGRYYLYDELDCLPCNPGGRHSHLVRMAHRLCARFPWRNVWIDPGLPEIYSHAPGTAERTQDASADLCIARGHLPAAALERLAKPGADTVASLVIDPEPAMLREIEETMPRGVILEGHDVLIALARRDIAFIKYAI